MYRPPANQIPVMRSFCDLQLTGAVIASFTPYCGALHQLVSVVTSFSPVSYCDGLAKSCAGVQPIDAAYCSTTALPVGTGTE